jgi:hypothetical protein
MFGCRESVTRALQACYKSVVSSPCAAVMYGCGSRAPVCVRANVCLPREDSKRSAIGQQEDSMRTARGQQEGSTSSRTTRRHVTACKPTSKGVAISVRKVLQAVLHSAFKSVPTKH